MSKYIKSTHPLRKNAKRDYIIFQKHSSKKYRVMDLAIEYGITPKRIHEIVAEQRKLREGASHES